jgi:hypothetical protein
MSAQPAIDPHRKPEVASPYCSDPNCGYCRQLRDMHEQVSTHEVVPPVRTDSDSP